MTTATQTISADQAFTCPDPTITIKPTTTKVTKPKKWESSKLKCSAIYTNQQVADEFFKKGYCPVPLKETEGGKVPAVVISVPKHGDRAWSRDKVKKYNFNNDKVSSVGILLTGDALVIDIDGYEKDEDGNKVVNTDRVLELYNHIPENIRKKAIRERTKGGLHLWFADDDHLKCSMKAIVDKDGNKLDIDILKVQNGGTGRIVKIHDWDSFPEGLPHIDDLPRLDLEFLKWFDSVRSDYHFKKPVSKRSKKRKVTNDDIPTRDPKLVAFEEIIWALSVDRCIEYQDWWRIFSYAQTLKCEEAYKIVTEWSSQVKEKENYSRAKYFGENIGASPELSAEAFEKFCKFDCPALWSKYYGDVMNLDLEAEIEKCFIKVTDKSVAGLLYKVCGHEIVAVPSVKDFLTYRFNGVRWILDDLHAYLGKNLTTKCVKAIDHYHSVKMKEYLEELAEAAKKAEEGKKDESGDIRDKLSQLSKAYLQLQGRLENTSGQKGVFAQFAHISLPLNAKFADKLDTDNNLIGFENGVFDLEKGEFRRARNTDYIMKSTGYDWEEEDKEVTKHLSEKFINKVFVDEKLRNFWLKDLASCADGELKNQFMRIWTNGGSNGKSMVSDLLKYTFGEYCGKMDTAFITSARGSADGAKPALMALKGCRFAMMEEPENDKGLNEQLIKEYTGGSTICGRQLYGTQVEFKPQFSMIMSCNDLPDCKDNTLGWARRLKITPFQSCFGYDHDENKLPEDHKDNYVEKTFLADTTIAKNFDSWKLAFFHLISKQYKAYLSNPDDSNGEVQKMTEAYLSANCPFQQFVADDLVMVTDEVLNEWNENHPDDKKKKTSDLRATFSEVEGWFVMWLKHHGKTMTMNSRALQKLIKKHINSRRLNSGWSCIGVVKKYYLKKSTGGYGNNFVKGECMVDDLDSDDECYHPENKVIDPLDEGIQGISDNDDEDDEDEKPKIFPQKHYDGMPTIVNGKVIQKGNVLTFD